MHDEHLAPKRQRDVNQREAAILDAERQLIQSLFDYGSATHPDPVLRSTIWTRERAMPALATATAVAQRLFTTTAIPGSLPARRDGDSPGTAGSHYALDRKGLNRQDRRATRPVRQACEGAMSPRA
jgi:hypothetical protein